MTGLVKIEIQTAKVDAVIAAQEEFLELGFDIVDGKQIETAEEKLQVEEILKFVKIRLNTLDDARKEAVGPAKKELSAIDARAKKVKDALVKLERKLKYLLVQLEKRRREAEEARLAAVAEAAEEGDEEAAQALLVQETEALPSSGGVTTSDVWTFEVVHATKIPSEYWVLDEKKIRQRIQAGAREIPGLRIFQEPRVSVRAR